MSGGEIFSYGWREDHARKGDEALEAAVRALGSGNSVPMSVVMAAMANSQALATIAQAHYAAANVRARPIRDVQLPSPGRIVSSEPDGAFTTGLYRPGGCSLARFDHASPPYGPQCELPQGHGGDHVLPA